MPSIGAAVQPTEVPQLRCPRCWVPAPFLNLNAVTWRCARCEWKFQLPAPAVASPAVPLTTVPVTNSTGTVVAVTVTGGTLTFVFVSGTQAGTTAGTYLVPVGGTISVTYSAAPTWAWALPAVSAGVSAGGTALTFAPTGTNTAFTLGQVLVVDPAGTADVVTVSGTPTAVSVPVGALNAAHLTGVLVAVAVPVSAHPSVETVPVTSY